MVNFHCLVFSESGLFVLKRKPDHSFRFPSLQFQALRPVQTLSTLLPATSKIVKPNMLGSIDRFESFWCCWQLKQKQTQLPTTSNDTLGGVTKCTQNVEFDYVGSVRTKQPLRNGVSNFTSSYLCWISISLWLLFSLEDGTCLGSFKSIPLWSWVHSRDSREHLCYCVEQVS